VIDTAGLLGELHGLRMMGSVQKPITVDKAEALLVQLLEVPGLKPETRQPVPSGDFPGGAGL
jgi:hypothetical protein